MSKIIYSCAIVLLVIVGLTECFESINVPFMYKDKAVLDCGSTGWNDEDITFYRVRKVETITEGSEPVTEEVTEEVTPYADERTGHEKAVFEESTLTLTDLRKEEIVPDYFCGSSKTDEKLHFVKQIHPFLMHPDKLSQTVTEGGFVEFRCEILYGNDTNIEWEWRRSENDTKIEASDNIVITSDQFSTTMKIELVNMEHKGMIKCEATNMHGSHSAEFHLRVKDTLAALWPFLGIVAEVLLLCVIILIYEKKCNKKQKGEQDNEQTENLMGKDSAGGVTKRSMKN